MLRSLSLKLNLQLKNSGSTDVSKISETHVARAGVSSGGDKVPNIIRLPQIRRDSLELDEADTGNKHK